MPKVKVHSGAAKRFKKTGSGRYKCKHANKSHILTKMTTKRKRHLRETDARPRQGRQAAGGAHVARSLNAVVLEEESQCPESNVVWSHIGATRKF